MTLKKSKDIFQNVEGLQDYNIVMPETRKPGLSAMLRVKNEAEYLERSVMSIIGWMDEVVICVQGGPSFDHHPKSDPTFFIALILEEKYPDKIKVYVYPFDSFPNGPGHSDQKRNSVYERAYFYNWCLARTNHEYVCKWDGDMVALDGLYQAILEGFVHCDFICFHGAEMVSETHQSIHPYTASDPRAFKVTDQTYYVTGPYCEQLNPDTGLSRHNILPGHQFKHFKWAKSMASITKAWPENWQDIPHFQGLMKRKKQGQRYV